MESGAVSKIPGLCEFGRRGNFDRRERGGCAIQGPVFPSDMRGELDVIRQQALLFETGRRDAELVSWNRLWIGGDVLLIRNRQPGRQRRWGDGTIRGCSKEKPAGCEEKQRCIPGQAHDLFNSGSVVPST